MIVPIYKVTLKSEFSSFASSKNTFGFCDYLYDCVLFHWNYSKSFLKEASYVVHLVHIFLLTDCLISLKLGTQLVVSLLQVLLWDIFRDIFLVM